MGIVHSVFVTIDQRIILHLLLHFDVVVFRELFRLHAGTLFGRVLFGKCLTLPFSNLTITSLSPSAHEQMNIYTLHRCTRDGVKRVACFLLCLLRGVVNEGDHFRVESYRRESRGKDACRVALIA